jgi:hypothetical protein
LIDSVQSSDTQNTCSAGFPLPADADRDDRGDDDSHRTIEDFFQCVSGIQLLAAELQGVDGHQPSLLAAMAIGGKADRHNGCYHRSALTELGDAARLFPFEPVARLQLRLEVGS